MDALEENINDTFDAASVAAGLRREAEVIERLLKALPPEKQVDEEIRARLLEMVATRDHLLAYSFIVEHEDALDRDAAEIRNQLAHGTLKPGQSLEDVIARLG